MRAENLLERGAGQISIDAANWLKQLAWEQVPAEVITHTKRRILDVLGVMLATTATEVASRVRDAAVEDGGEGYRFIGLRGEASLPGAAFVNGVLGAILEFDDTHTESAIHVTAPTAAVGIPYAGAKAVSGKDLILGILGGGELSCRLGRIGPRMHGLALHATGLFGTFGAAYTLAKLRGLSASQTVNAIGLAGSMAVGSRAGWDEGADAKSMQVGIAANAGARAVALAAHGVTGPSSVFDSTTGFFRAHAQAKEHVFRFGRLTEALGQDWQSLNIASKAYPTGYVSHPFMEAAIILKGRGLVDVDAIERVTCYASPMMAETKGARESKLRPRTPWHARVSVYHQTAEALVVGKIDKTSFSEANLADPRINAVTDKVHVELDPAFDDVRRSGGRLTIKYRDGREVSHTVENMRGTTANPISEADYVAKFRANAAGVIPPAAIDELIEGVLRLDASPNVAPLVRKLSP